MCGIVGVVDLQRRRRLPAVDVFDTMVDSLARRGPDGRGVWRSDDVALGHRRLAIIDVTTASAQPFVKDGVALVFNGEIYNYKALRRQLDERGHSFRTAGDTEVVCEAWRAWGPRCVERFRGIFAFAVVDGPTVFLARDHVGIKPLFYRLDDGVLWFGSELKALLADDRVPRRAAPDAVDCFLTHGWVPSPLTPFAGIAQLPPASTLSLAFGAASTSMTPRPYWKPRASERPITLDDACAELDARLGHTVREQLVSDVPVGAFLSGGLDSASIVAAMRDGDGDVRSFSLGFDTAGFDETADAAHTARLLGARHHCERVGLDLEARIDDIADTNDDLLADASFVATDRLCAMTRQQVTVALSGDGADEILAGYPTYAAAHLAGVWRTLPSPLRGLARHALRALPVTTARYPAREMALRFVDGAARGPSRDFAGFRVLFDDATRRQLLRDPAEGRAIERYAGAVDDADADTLLKRLLIADLTHFLPADMLVKVDRASMRHGLEVRVPFLDPDFIEFALSLPSSLLLSSTGTTKVVLREHVRRRVSAYTARGKKRGFSVPVGAAFKARLGDVLHDELRAEAFAATGPIHVDGVLRLLADHRAGRADHGHALYAALVLAKWWRRFGPGASA